jgi:hypothetical protein
MDLAFFPSPQKTVQGEQWMSIPRYRPATCADIVASGSQQLCSRPIAIDHSPCVSRQLVAGSVWVFATTSNVRRKR